MKLQTSGKTLLDFTHFLSHILLFSSSDDQPSINPAVSLQPICCDQSVPEGHDSSDPHSLCPGTVPARPAGRIHRSPRLPVETTGAYSVHTRAPSGRYPQTQFFLFQVLHDE